MAPARKAADKETAPESATPPEAAPKEATAPPVRYRVLRAITLGNGQTLMRGATLEIAADDPDWPARRPSQLVKQGFLQRLEG